MIRVTEEVAIEAAARAAHEANRAYSFAIGDGSQLPWTPLPGDDEAGEEQRDSVREGVRNVLRGFGPRESHNAWWLRKDKEGWGYGSVKDLEKKLHPCCRPYDDLPREQKMKDSIFVQVVSVVLTALNYPPVPR